MKTIGIVQARMGSTRLPGKTLLPLAGKPLLWHVFNRARKATKLDEVVLATTTNRLDDVLEQFAKDNEIKYVRGPEQDVLERFILAGEQFGAEGIIRINSDVPLLEPKEIDEVTLVATEQHLEAAYVDVSIPTAVAGFEFATLEALKKVRKATSDSYAHEHVTVYLRTEPNFATHVFVKPNPIYAIEGFHPAIDIPIDYEFWKNIYEKFYKEGSIIDLAEVVAYLRANPAVMPKRPA